MAKRRNLNTQLNSLENQITSIFKIPMCLTEPLTVGFVLDLVDIFSTDEKWLGLEKSERTKQITRVMEKLESENKLSSKMSQVKVRHFDDDETPPKLNKRVRVFSLIR